MGMSNWGDEMEDERFGGGHLIWEIVGELGIKRVGLFTFMKL